MALSKVTLKGEIVSIQKSGGGFDSQTGQIPAEGIIGVLTIVSKLSERAPLLTSTLNLAIEDAAMFRIGEEVVMTIESSEGTPTRRTS